MIGLNVVASRDIDFESRLTEDLTELNLKSLSVKTTGDRIDIAYETDLSLPYNEGAIATEFARILSIVNSMDKGNFKRLKIRATYYGHLTETPYYEKEFRIGSQ